jgi:hypothetical protein
MPCQFRKDQNKEEKENINSRLRKLVFSLSSKAEIEKPLKVALS